MIKLTLMLVARQGSIILLSPPLMEGRGKKFAQGREFKVYKEREEKKGKKKEKNGKEKGKKGEKRRKKEKKEKKEENKRKRGEKLSKKSRGRELKL